MAEQWYYAREKQKYGPFTATQILQLASSGKLLSTDTLVAKWAAAAEVKGLFADQDTPPVDGAQLPAEADRFADSTLLRDIVNFTGVAEAGPSDGGPDAEELRRLVETLHSELQAAEAKAEARWKAREQEYEGLIDEKSEVIRQLHQQMQQVQEGAPAGEGPSEAELVALHEELQRERDQLKQDEKVLMDQMRDMEVQMSKERADLARQRGELQRLQNELKRELELAARDAAVREKLAPLFRLQEEIGARRGEPTQRPRTPANEQPAPAVAGKPAAGTKAVSRSGFFKRLFQRDQDS